MALESFGSTNEKLAEFLEPLVESCLPETMLHAWESSRSVEDSSPQDSARSLVKLLCFLRNEVQSEEMIKLARSGAHNGKELNVRTILDSGSQKSYISERVIKGLKLQPKSKQTIVYGLFGGGRETSPHCHLVFDVYLKNFEDTYAHSVDVLSQKKIIDLCTLQELKEKNITLSDLEAKEHDIELLLGADVIGNILTDAIGITDPTEDAKRKYAHSDFLNQFKENLSVLPDGRLVPPQFWRLVPVELNPADLLSRDSSPRLFSDSFWWEGPSWLLENPINWPIDRLACETSEVEREKKGKLGYVIWLQDLILGHLLTYPKTDDLVPLSLAMFLVENRNLDVPDIDYRDTVNLPKVIRLIPEKDGKIRTVQLKTRTGTMVRPIQRVYPLEAHDILSDPNDSSSDLARVSRHGRVIKAPEKLNFFIQALYIFESKRC
ncbi:putative RNA-directed DNA polymerase from transposon X-element [Trichonephila clavipes]|uniref:Putative RNA-directed DNA polymerase from transposon X-element n=1 Tax=Trichonephila clavipes TaxID=2585209 RepID=A0A8X6W8L9_TRICX|nr:putative RNA-directed DNA polymerase from transposon X-element [Trichonephila clavipes]